MRKTNKILVTGSAGFIGKHLMKALGKDGVGYDIRSTVFADINDADMLKEMIKAVKPRAIVHLAAISTRQAVDKDPEQALKTNLIGSFNVMRIAHKYKIPVFLASSAATYKPELSLYGTTKDCMERLAQMFDNIVIMRFYNVYGPGSKSVVNKFINRAKKGKIVKLYGNTTRDYIYIDDVVKAIMDIINAPYPDRIYEIGTGRAITLKKLRSIVAKALNMPLLWMQEGALNEIQYSKCDSGMWYKITLEKGIRRLI